MNNQEKLTTKGTQDEEKHNTIHVGHHCAQINTHNVNKTCALLHTTGGKDVPSIVFMPKSYRTLQHGNQNINTHNRTIQNEQHEPHQKLKRG
jgi:hypothetical protein